MQLTMLVPLVLAPLAMLHWGICQPILLLETTSDQATPLEDISNPMAGKLGSRVYSKKGDMGRDGGTVGSTRHLLKRTSHRLARPKD